MVGFVVQPPPYDRLDVVVDTTPPQLNVSLASAAFNYTSNVTVLPCVIVGDLNPVLTRIVLDNNAQVVSVEDSGCGVVAGLLDGNHTLTAIATDAADNTSPDVVLWCVRAPG